MLWGDWRVCVIETPRSSLDKRSFFRKPTFNSLYTPFGSPVSGGTETFLTVKEGSTFLTKPLFPQGREDVTALQCYICPTCPSPAGGSLTHSQALALSKRARDVTALRCSEPLRSKVGGASKPCAMVLRDGTAWGCIMKKIMF